MTQQPVREQAATRAPREDGGPSFRDLGVSDHIVALLEKAGILDPFPIQEMTIPDALAGRDVCGKAKTGSGKTLAFGLPMLERVTTARKRRPQGLILVPTRELANQVTSVLAPLARAVELRLLAVYGGASMVNQIRALHDGADIVVATPGRLNDLLERKEVSLADVRMVVVDEADQMADMGFLPQVKDILDRVEPDAQTLLFSATLDGSVGALIKRYQHDPVMHEVQSETQTVETIEQRFIGVERRDKVRIAADICAGSGRTMVFVRTKHGADRLARQLNQEGVDAEPIHGGHAQNKRERTMARFSKGKLPVLVATNVAARGIHVDDVETVLHFDPPEDGKTYLHRSGRTARAGASGVVVTLVLPEERPDVGVLQREAGIYVSMIEMEPGDPRLGDLLSWDPEVEYAKQPHREAPQYSSVRRPRPGGPGGGHGRTSAGRPRRW